ncbi:MAG: hypothetical protein ABIT09_07115 [Croceibacterium sp.]
MADAIEAPPAAQRRKFADVGLVFAVVCAIILALTVEWMAGVVLGGGRDGHALIVLALFVVPLLTSLGAIGFCLASRPVWARWASALSILLVPPVLLISGAHHG